MKFRRFSYETLRGRVELDFRDKGVVGIVGANGCGKSLALNALAGLHAAGINEKAVHLFDKAILTCSVDISSGNELRTAMYSGGKMVQRASVGKTLTAGAAIDTVVYYSSLRGNLSGSPDRSSSVNAVVPMVFDLVRYKTRDSVILVDDIGLNLDKASTNSLITFLMKKALNSDCQLIMSGADASVFGMLPTGNVFRLEGGTNPVDEAVHLAGNKKL